MTRIVLALALLLPSFAQAREYKVGVTRRSFTPPGPYNWRAAKTHALVTQLWYPAADAAVEKPQWIGPPDAPLFALGKAAPEAPLIATPQRLPLIVLSHGTGGSANIMSWLGTALAARGFVVAAVNHPGNNALEPYTVQGFKLWWERAHDLSTVIDYVLADATFGPRLDSRRIGAVGFSLGGFTMMILAGAISDRAAFDAFCSSKNADDMCKRPPEFTNPALMSRDDDLARTDQEYANSLAHERQSRRDPRVRAIFAIAPALGPAFPIKDLARIHIPVEIVAGAADDNVPIASSAQYYARNIAYSKLTIFPGGVSHYVFLATCTAQGKQAVPLLCTDAPTVDREAIHHKTAQMAADFFITTLNQPISPDASTPR